MAAKKRINFVVHPVQDADLIAFLNGQPNMSEFIRAVLYEKMGRKPAENSPAAPQTALDLADLADVVRQAVRAEFTVAQFLIGSSGAPLAQPAQSDASPDEQPQVTALMNSLFDF